MKTLRILLLVAVMAMLAVVVSDYLGTQRNGAAGAVTEPSEIPRNLDSKASRWTWSQSSANERKVEIHAATVEQIRDTTLLQLRGVELLIYRTDDNSYDRIVCNSARFDGETLYSDEEVTVILGLVAGDSGRGKGQPTTIRSTGVTFQSKTGVASTDRYTEYEFDGGSGHSVGSFYDSVHRYFRMNSDAYVERRASTEGQPPLKIRAGELTYYEIGQRVDLKKGASLDRGGQRLEAAEAFVHLEGRGVIRQITATDAHGEEQQASRLVRFETPRMDARYSPQQILEHVYGQGPSVMTSESESSVIRANGNRIDLNYETPAGSSESVLRETYVRESAVLEARPGRGSTAGQGRIRRVSSESLHLKMDDTAQNMEFVETMARGRLDLIPAVPDGSRDVLDADRIKMFYAPGNRMEKLQAAGKVELKRQPRREAANGRKAEPLHTHSGGLLGQFDPASGDLRTLRQWGNFRFEQGDRSGRAEEAEFDVAANQIELKNRAEVWEPDSRTAADRLTLDEKSSDFTAQGNVSSVYQEKPAAQSSGAGVSEVPPAGGAETSPAGELFKPSEPVYAAAERMVSNQQTGVLEYHGKARLWQGADRVEAEQIRIERREKKLTAEGNVVSVITEKSEAPAAAGESDTASPAVSPVEVHADAMLYDEATRQVAYNGHVELRREALRVRANDLDAWLAPPEASGSRLDKAVARGAVEIVETAATPGQPQRKGFGERAQFFPGEDKVILEGKPAQVSNARQDTTRGSELTYYLGDDRLLVLGSPQQRSYSLRRKKEP
jgi:lipopolysaccharide export system protein LptA